MSVQAPNAAAWTQSYGYDAVRRLKSVSSPAGEFDYTYDPEKLLRVDKLSLPGGAAITNLYDSVARLLTTKMVASAGAVLDAEGYGYNLAGQVTAETNTAGDYRDYTYDNAGELTAETGMEPGGTARSDERLTYAYDAAGNLSQRKRSPALSSQVDFGVNDLNEITNGILGYNSPLTGWSGTIPVSGSTTSPATNVTVNGSSASLYGDNTFARYENVTNGVNPFTAIASDVYGRHSTNTSWVNVIVTNSAYRYDANGNLTNDGIRNFAYDDENELIAVWVTNGWSNNFAYDGLLRKRVEKEYDWNGGAWIETNEVRYIYDGNVVVQERNGNNLPTVTYTRGNDLSGTFQGAGGIGGLLARTDMGLWVGGSQFATAFYHADGNGNISYMAYPNQTEAAKYLYDPYGNMLAMSGPVALANSYRFSSKEWDAGSGLYYYGFRFYDPNLQRWPNQDPIGEAGGINLYRAMGNNPLDWVDPFGLWGVQFGNFNIGYGNPNYAFDSSSWYDVANGAAAVADGLLPQPYFQDLYQNGNPFDENGGSYPAYYQNALDEANNIGWAIAWPLKGNKPTNAKGNCPPNNGLGNQPMMGMARKPDQARVDQVAKEFNIDRYKFGDYVEKQKRLEGRGGKSVGMDQLRDWGEEYQNIYGQDATGWTRAIEDIEEFGGEGGIGGIEP
jgi:RHS repeat-associated protein